MQAQQGQTPRPRPRGLKGTLPEFGQGDNLCQGSASGSESQELFSGREDLEKKPKRIMCTGPHLPVPTG